MLTEKLKTWDYYYDKLPLYFKNDDRIEEHFHAIFDLLVTIDGIEDELLSFFDIMAEGYLELINSYDESVEKDKSDILDKIGQIYGVTRDFDVVVDDVTKHLHLNNAEFLVLIKARIIQMNYDGSYRMAKQFYESVNLPVSLYTSDGHANARLYLIHDDTLSDNFVDMFKAGLFVIKSMGISYDLRYVEDFDYLAVFDSDSPNRLWDVGMFS